MNFEIDNKFGCRFRLVVMCWCATINCNNKKNNGSAISDYLKIKVFIKGGVMLPAAKLIICHPKSKIYEHFRRAIPRNKRNVFLAILLSVFITCFTSFIKELPNSIQAEVYSESYQRFKIQFLATIVNSSRGVFRTE